MSNVSGDIPSSNPNNGSGSGIIPFNLPLWMAMAGFTAVAWYNVVELNVNIYMTFKKRRGVYFWSLLISSWGIIGHSLSLVFKFWTNENVWWVCTMLMFGWWAMVTGQAFVLYSRLHLVVRDRRILHGVLIMIIVDGVCLHIPTSVMTYGSSSAKADLFLVPFSYMEKVQMTIFTVQEAIISGIYVYFTIRLLKPTFEGNRRRTRSVMLQLIVINVLIVCMDLCVLALEYHGDYYIEACLKSMVYSVKLKLEFAVLNQLMRLAQSSIAHARAGTAGIVYGTGASARAGRSGVADDDVVAKSASGGAGGPRPGWQQTFPRSFAKAEAGGPIHLQPTLNETEAAISKAETRIQVSKEIEVEFSGPPTRHHHGGVDTPPAERSGSESRSDVELRHMGA